MISEMQKLYEPSQNDENISVTRGFNMAFGVLSPYMLKTLGVELIECLLKNVVPKNKESDDADTRKQSVKSLGLILNTLGPSNIDSSQLKDIIEAFYAGLNDYALDRRGDVGSWVREETMQGLTDFIRNLTSTEGNEVAIKTIGADQT